MDDLKVMQLRDQLIVPMQRLCLLEAVAAVLCQDVLKSNLDLTKDEREGLIQIKLDEADHYLRAVKVLKALPKFDQEQLSAQLRDYHVEHQERWIGPIGRIARLHRDEGFVMRFGPTFEGVISTIVPEEGGDFVRTVMQDEPRHHKWGQDVLKRLAGNDEAQRRFIQQQSTVRDWPASMILREFDSIRKQLAIR